MTTKKAILYSLVTLSLMLANFAQATIYKTTDEDGNTVFTDVRPENLPSEEVELRQINPTRPGSVSRDWRRGSAFEQNKITYERVEITEPANNATIRNQQSFTVRIKTRPKIARGHRVRLLLDGKVVGKPQRKLIFTLKNVDRGTHSLTAEVIDSKKKVITSASNTVHVHRTIVRPKAAK